MGQVCCQQQGGSGVEVVEKPVEDEQESVADIPNVSKADVKNNGAAESEATYKKMATLVLLGVDFPDKELPEDHSLCRMKELAERLKNSYGPEIFNVKPAFKHLQIQANKAKGAPRKLVVTGIDVTLKGAGIAKDAAGGALSAIKVVSGKAVGATGSALEGLGAEKLGQVLKGAQPAKPMFTTARKLPGSSPGKKTVETAVEEEDLEPGAADDVQGHTQADAAEGVEIPNIIGIWKCINTWGLEGFLKSCGIGFVQRKAAMGAPWPWWAFEIDDDLKVHFVNHGPLGEVDEHIDTSGKEYVSVDGKKQQMKNTAWWEGDSLVINRSGPQGEFQERRTLDVDDKLKFSLELMNGEHAGQKWGRVFERGDAHFHT